ncbi:MAG: hypothetical protein WBD28_07975 [Candidatus Zixiibacteriota bacterium]
MFYLSLVKRVFVVFCLLSLFFIDAHSTTPAKVLKKDVTFQKVQEEKYDNATVPVAFGSVVSNGREQIYPKVILLPDKEVRFLDENGEVLTRKPLVHREYIESETFRGRGFILSKKGNFVGIHDYIGKVGDPSDYLINEEYTICNDKGEEIYKIKIPQEGKSMEDQFVISDKDGSAVGTRIQYGAIDFYHPDGSVKTVPLFGELGWGLREGYVNFSGDGEYLALLMEEIPESKRKLHPVKGDLWIMLFDINGNVQWRRKVDEHQLNVQHPEKIAISEHGEYLAFKAYTIERESTGKIGKILPRKGDSRLLTSVTLSIYDKEGKELSLKDTSLYIFNYFRFSPKADYLAMAGDNIIRLMSTKDGSIMFEKELQKDFSIRELLFCSDGEHLIVRAKAVRGKEKVLESTGGFEQDIRVYTHRFSIFTIKGDKIWQNDYSDFRKIFSVGRFLVLSFPDRYEILKKD